MSAPYDRLPKPIIIDPEGLPYGVVGCEECGNESVCTSPTEPENCPHCGAYLWEDGEPDDLPSDISAFSGDLG